MFILRYISIFILSFTLMFILLSSLFHIGIKNIEPTLVPPRYNIIDLENIINSFYSTGNRRLVNERYRYLKYRSGICIIFRSPALRSLMTSDIISRRRIEILIEDFMVTKFFARGNFLYFYPICRKPNSDGQG